MTLQSILPLKQVCFDNVENLPNNETWEVVENLVYSLKPVYEATMTLQMKQLLLGDFHKTWLSLKSVIKSQGNNLSESLHSCIENREKQFDNDVINAALFLDPRFRKTLNSDEKFKVKLHLKK